MEIDILNKKENKVLDRTEIKFDCIYSGEATPTLLSVKSKLVALLNTKKELIVVDSIQPRYGEPKASGYAKIYGSKESLEDIETEHVIAKNKEPEVEIPEDEESSEDEVTGEEIEESSEDEDEDSEDEDDKTDDVDSEKSDEE